MVIALKPFALRAVFEEDGAQLVEYILLLMLVTIVALVAVRSYGQRVSSKMGDNSNSVTSALN